MKKLHIAIAIICMLPVLKTNAYKVSVAPNMTVYQTQEYCRSKYIRSTTNTPYYCDGYIDLSLDEVRNTEKVLSKHDPERLYDFRKARANKDFFTALGISEEAANYPTNNSDNECLKYGNMDNAPNSCLGQIPDGPATVRQTMIILQKFDKKLLEEYKHAIKTNNYAKAHSISNKASDISYKHKFQY